MTPLAINKRTALAHTAAFKREISEAKRNRVRILRRIAKSIDAGEYKVAGFSTLESWLLHIGIDTSVSHFLRLLHNVRALKGISETQLEAMPEGNAHLLARLPEHIREKTGLDECAVRQKPAEFRETFAKVREKHLGQAAEAPWGTFAVRLPSDALAVVNEAIAKLGRVLEVDLESDEVRPKSMITVMTAWATLVTTTDESRLKTEIEGDSGPSEQ